MRPLFNPKRPIPFSEFMAWALYEPEFGYYARTASPFGPRGDFVTAPEISSLFGQSLARQCQQVLSELKGGCILEIGAGSGKMAGDILMALEKSDGLPEQYFICEISAARQQQQRQYLELVCPHLLSKIIWLSKPPEKHFQGIILANEVLDALPVELFTITEQGPSAIGVIEENKQFKFKTYKNPDLIQQLNEYALPDLPVGYRSEINLGLKNWLIPFAQSLEKGVMLLIDYGYPRHTYYHSQRFNGTLQCFHKHQAHEDVLSSPGEQDISCHVDFTLLAECASSAGLHVSGFTHQGAFLLACGITDFMEMEMANDDLNRRELYPLDLEELGRRRSHETPEQTLSSVRMANGSENNPRTSKLMGIAQEIKKLTLPTDMGETCKVMALTRDYDGILLGFNAADFMPPDLRYLL